MDNKCAACNGKGGLVLMDIWVGCWGCRGIGSIALEETPTPNHREVPHPRLAEAKQLQSNRIRWS